MAQRRDSAASENTPLLGTAIDDPALPPYHENGILEDVPKSKNGDQEVIANGHVEEDDTPLPLKQIFLLCFARLIDPIAFFGIFPFVNTMIEEVGHVDKADVGFYTGTIESCFSFTQMLFMISWGQAADRLGRKPVLIFSLAGLAMSTAIFGFAKSIPQMIIFRCLSGVFAGTIVTVRAMISENSTPKTQARAFSLFAFSGNVGIFLGPIIGGVLLKPAKNYPNLFGGIQFFKDFPYALPTLTNGAIAAVCTVVCALFVKETLRRKLKSVEGEEEVPAETALTTWEILKSPGVPSVLFIYGHVMLLGLAYTAVAPVFFYTPPNLGGYGFSPAQISAFLSAIGVSQSIWLLFVFPNLHKKYGTLATLRGCLIAWPIFFVAAPVCNEFLRRDWRVVFWIVAPIFQIAGSGVAMAFTAVQLALNDISPSPMSLGTLNALSLTLTSAIRTVGPALFASIFAAGVRSQFMNGHLVWLVLILLGLMGIFMLRWFPEKADSTLKDRRRE